MEMLFKENYFVFSTRHSDTTFPLELDLIINASTVVSSLTYPPALFTVQRIRRIEIDLAV